MTTRHVARSVPGNPARAAPHPVRTGDRNGDQNGGAP